MKKYLLALLFTALLPIAAQATLDLDDYDYPGFREDARELKSYYAELKKDQRAGKKRAVRNDKLRIANKEAEIRENQDDFEDYTRDHRNGRGNDHDGRWGNNNRDDDRYPHHR